MGQEMWWIHDCIDHQELAKSEPFLARCQIGYLLKGQNLQQMWNMVGMGIFFCYPEIVGASYLPVCVNRSKI